MGEYNFDGYKSVRKTGGWNEEHKKKRHKRERERERGNQIEMRTTLYAEIEESTLMYRIAQEKISSGCQRLRVIELSYRHPSVVDKQPLHSNSHMHHQNK